MQINKNETKSFIHFIKNERGGEEGGGGGFTLICEMKLIIQMVHSAYNLIYARIS